MEEKKKVGQAAGSSLQPTPASPSSLFFHSGHSPISKNLQREAGNSKLQVKIYLLEPMEWLGLVRGRWDLWLF